MKGTQPERRHPGGAAHASSQGDHNAPFAEALEHVHGYVSADAGAA